MAHLTKKQLLAEKHKYYFPIIPPEKAVGDIMKIKLESKNIKKFTDWDAPRVGPECELIALKRKLENVREELELKRKEMFTKRDQIDNKWAKLIEDENSLRNNFIEFNKFIRENYKKRQRAELKFNVEKERKITYSQDVENVKSQLEYLKDVKKNMEEETAKHAFYEKFIKNVVEESPIFQQDDDVIVRYESLVEAREELARKQKNRTSAVENMKNAMVTFIKEKNNEYYTLINKMTALESRLEIAKRKTSNTEILIARVKSSVNNKRDEIGRIKDCCWNIYLNMCQRKEIEPIYKYKDFENQLIFIRRTLSELKIILEKSKRTIRKSNMV